MIGFRPRLLPTLITGPIVLLCLGLGFWQIQRLHWKEALIATREAALAAPPTPLPRSRAEAQALEFRRVIDSGVFLNDKEILLHAIGPQGGAGFDVLTPLREPGGRIVFVNRGYVPTELKDPATRAAGQPAGGVRIAGRLRLPPGRKPGWFVPNNEPGRNEWFWIDLTTISAADRLAADGSTNLAPFYIAADAAPNPGGWPKGGYALPALPNDHLQYAITWFSLAAAAAVIYLLSQRTGRGRPMTAYLDLEARFGRLGAVEEAIAVLNWDAAAMMPPGGAAARAEQLATLRVIAHQLLTAPQMADLLADAEAEAGSLDLWRRANLREMRRRWRHAAAVPDDLVEALSRARSASETVWREARPADDFAAALPGLERVLAVTREVADAKAAAFGTGRYEALLEQYEPGIAVATIDRLFGEIEGFLPGLLDAVLARQAACPPPAMPRGPFAIADQRRAALALMQRIGFDFAHGRLDESAHPFCGGTPDDVRLTTRYDREDFSKALMGTLHETGHALYERGLPAEWRRQPVGRARGMAMHESQSLLLEMQVCRSRAFAGFAAPVLREVFAGDGGAWDADALYFRQIAVYPGPIRVDADEVTYPAHVILRYRLERAMIAGDLQPRDLPGIWAEGLRQLIGVVPETDRDGVLQDIHWYDGYWGYFPTYTLGALIAAQLFAAARAALPDLAAAIGSGEFGPLLEWLRHNVHANGSLLSTDELVMSATGQPLGTASLERHLRQRYLG